MTEAYSGVVTQLVDSVKRAMCSEQVLERVVLWTDSIRVLYWLQNKGGWKQFVKHRVDEILRLTKGMLWRHCPGLDNPADIGSRGCKAMVHNG